MEALDEVDLLVRKQTEEKERRAAEMQSLDLFLSHVSALPDMFAPSQAEKVSLAGENLDSTSTSDEMSIMATREISLETRSEERRAACKELMNLGMEPGRGVPHGDRRGPPAREDTDDSQCLALVSG